jgi:hypothetical protein
MELTQMAESGDRLLSGKQNPTNVPTYPVLWAHDAKRERTLLFEGDTEAVARKAAAVQDQAFIEDRVSSIWATASHCHCNLDFRFNSQPTAMQFTPQQTIGGRAWMSIRLSSIEYEKALVLWANTSMGFLLHWWHATKQQPGRGSIGKSTLQTLPTLDVTALHSRRLKKAVQLFDVFCRRELLPMHEIDRDAVRQQLDEQFATYVLGFPESICEALDLLRRKLAKEPSIRGQK